jgi:ubiquinone/menaquinone biosynthesis C-methylase UbiE
MATHKEEVLDFWKKRAEHGVNAGTNDFLLKYLEEEALAARVPGGAQLLDIGCGNGSTLIRLCEQKGCGGIGLDYAETLLELARQTAEERGVHDRLKFFKGDVQQLDPKLGHFDHVMTQRCLINLETDDEQKKAFGSIVSLLRPGGRYYMIEAFNDGNRKLNELREIFRLEPMTAPWHNHFLELNEALSWEKSYPVAIEEVSHFASTYYFLSRVVYAKLAADRGEALEYDSDINKLSLQLPSMGEFGATKLIVWRKLD